MAANPQENEQDGELFQMRSIHVDRETIQEDNPLTETDEFKELLLACRRGNLRTCQNIINQGVNINGRDRFDYTPLILASLCGHYELVKLLLDSGALAERNTFQGERCIYNALNDRIRNLLLQYDFSKTTDPYVYWSAHFRSLWTRTNPKTTDMSLKCASRSFDVHKFVLAARTPYFRRTLEAHPDLFSWEFSPSVPALSLQLALRFIYLNELPKALVPPGSGISEQDVTRGLHQISRQLEIEHLRDALSTSHYRLQARQQIQAEEQRALVQVNGFFTTKVLHNKLEIDVDRVADVKWDCDNPALADVFLRADEPETEGSHDAQDQPIVKPDPDGQGQPIVTGTSASTSSQRKPRKCTLYPVHKAMLIRSEYFDKMFSGDYLESQHTTHLHVITTDFSPAILEIILTYLYTETAICPLEHALDLLYAADMVFLDPLKNKAASAISALGNNDAVVDTTLKSHLAPEQPEMELINIFDVITAAWELGIQRLEEFTARYIAFRLEDYIDDPEFHDLIRKSAGRIKNRQETDTIELLDDIRYYLSERYRFRFENVGLHELLTTDTRPDGAGPVEGLNMNGFPGAQVAASVHEANLKAAGDAFAAQAKDHELMLQRIDVMLEQLNLDA